MAGLSKTTTYSIDIEVQGIFKHHCEKTGRTMSKIVENKIKEWLIEEGVEV